MTGPAYTCAYIWVADGLWLISGQQRCTCLWAPRNRIVASIDWIHSWLGSPGFATSCFCTVASSLTFWHSDQHARPDPAKPLQAPPQAHTSDEIRNKARSHFGIGS